MTNETVPGILFACPIGTVIHSAVYQTKKVALDSHCAAVYNTSVKSQKSAKTGKVCIIAMADADGVSTPQARTKKIWESCIRVDIPSELHNPYVA